jgi:glutaminyl-tRNA synthetase
MLDSPWRDRSVADNLREFENMRLGKYSEGQAVLRMKMDMKSPKTCASLSLSVPLSV